MEPTLSNKCTETNEIGVNTSTIRSTNSKPSDITTPKRVSVIIVNESERVNALDDCCTPHKNMPPRIFSTININESERVNALDDCCTPHKNMPPRIFSTININESERVNALDDCCTPHKNMFQNNLSFLPIERVVSQYLKAYGNSKYPTIEFIIDKNKVLLINALDGSYILKAKNEVLIIGYNAIDCLIKVFHLSYENSIEWLRSVFSDEEVKFSTQVYLN